METSQSSSAPAASDCAAASAPRLVLVTGGSRGIGRATCILLASKGYDVAVNYRADKSSADAVVREIESGRADGRANVGRGPGRAVAFKADVANVGDVRRLFDDVLGTFGRNPDGLVNNAGIIGPLENDIAALGREDVDKVFATNVYGPFYCCREFVRRASTKRGGNGGAIVNVSSGSAYIGNPLIYAMSKGALDSMTTGLSKSLPDEGIRINSIVPGVTDTDMPGKDLIESSVKVTPMKRMGRPEEIAEGIAFFLSDSSSYCSGAKLRISGGKP